MTATTDQKPIEIPGLGSLPVAVRTAISGPISDPISDPSGHRSGVDAVRAARMVGALLGMAVGDAVGTTFEFEVIDQPPYPTLATGPAVGVVGGGPFDLSPGQVTDDTQLAVCLSRSLVAHRAAPGGVDLVDLATRYVSWYEHAFDVGNQTASAIAALKSGVAVAAAGREVWHRSGRRAAGNGSLMRTTPIGVRFANAAHEGRPDLLVEAALSDSIVTHADPRCAIACAAFDLAIAEGVMFDIGPEVRHGVIAAAMIAAARAAIPLASERLRELWGDDAADITAIDEAEQMLQRDLDAALAPDPDVYSDEMHLHRTAGFVRVAFRLAFWHLVHTPSWSDALLDVASRGGDADTNGAIVGALLGARDGVQAIPESWLQIVLDATQPGPAEWADAHHPRHLLALVQRPPETPAATE